MSYFNMEFYGGLFRKTKFNCIETVGCGSSKYPFSLPEYRLFSDDFRYYYNCTVDELIVGVFLAADLGKKEHLLSEKNIIAEFAQELRKHIYYQCNTLNNKDIGRIEAGEIVDKRININKNKRENSLHNTSDCLKNGSWMINRSFVKNVSAKITDTPPILPDLDIAFREITFHKDGRPVYVNGWGRSKLKMIYGDQISDDFKISGNIDIEKTWYGKKYNSFHFYLYTPTLKGPWYDKSVDDVGNPAAVDNKFSSLMQKRVVELYENLTNKQTKALLDGEIISIKYI